MDISIKAYSVNVNKVIMWNINISILNNRDQMNIISSNHKNKKGGVQ
jgi:hypothetical protein